jgi:cytidyltransferase-like protein
MSVIGIVCEFNPFHNGHKYLIDSVKKQGDIVICVMSGNFVQRAEPAIFPKYVRVKAALLNGADIVLELPFIYATASAEFFAYNAVKILDSFGCDKLAFGTENTTIEQLNEIVDVLNDSCFNEKITEYLQTGESYASARQSALNSYGNDFYIDMPNNILAIEYIKAIRKLNSGIEPICINRIGAGYNDDFAVKEFASATHIRSLINQNSSFEKYVPANCRYLYQESINKGNYVSQEKYELASLALLRSRLYDNKESIAYMAEGLENRIDEAIRTSVTLDEIYNKVKTKRYAHSRVRRAVLCRQFNIGKNDLNIGVPYCRLLGFNEEIGNRLGEFVNNCPLPFITRFSDISKNDNDKIYKIFEYEDATTDFYNIVLNSIDICSKEKTFSPIKV